MYEEKLDRSTNNHLHDGSHFAESRFSEHAYEIGANVVSRLFTSMEDRSRGRALRKWKESIEPSPNPLITTSLSPISKNSLSSRARIQFISRQLNDAEGDFENYVGTLFKDLNSWDSPGHNVASRNMLHEFDEPSFDASPVKHDSDEKYYREKCKKLEEKIQFYRHNFDQVITERNSAIELQKTRNKEMTKNLQEFVNKINTRISSASRHHSQIIDELNLKDIMLDNLKSSYEKDMESMKQLIDDMKESSRIEVEKTKEACRKEFDKELQDIRKLHENDIIQAKKDMEKKLILDYEDAMNIVRDLSQQELDKELIKQEARHKKIETTQRREYDRALKTKEIDYKAMLLRLNEDHLNKEAEITSHFTKCIDDLMSTTKLSRAKQTQRLRKTVLRHSFVSKVVRFRFRSSFNKWLKFLKSGQVIESLEAKRVEVLQKLAKKATNKSKLKRFTTWVHNTSIVKLETKTFSLIKNRSAHGLRKEYAKLQLRRALKLVKIHYLQLGWYAWKYLEHRRDVFFCAQRAMLKGAHSSLAAAFNKWCEVMQFDIKATKMMWRALSRCTRLKTALAWRSWMVFIRAEVESERVQKSKMNKLVGIGLKMMNSVKAKSFRKWLEVHTFNELKEQQALKLEAMRLENEQKKAQIREDLARNQMKRVLKAMTMSLLRAGWNTWKYSMRDTKRLLTGRRTIFKLIHHGLTAAFNKWIKCLEQEKERSRIMARVIVRCTRVRTAGAWRSWILYTRDRKEAWRILETKKATMRHISLRMMNTLKSKCMRKWIEVTRLMTLEVKQRKERERLLVASKGTTSVLRSEFAKTQMRRILKSMSLTLLRMGWNTWKHGERKKAVMRRARRVMFKAVHSTCVAALNQWKAACEYEKQVSLLMTRAILRCGRSKMRLGWRSWIVYVQYIQAEELKAKEQDAAMRHISLRMMNTLKSKCMRKWIEVTRLMTLEVKQRKERERLLVASKDTTSVLRSEFAKTQMRRILKSMSLTLLRMGWNTWKHVIKDRQALLSAYRVILNIINVKLIAAFNKWCEVKQFEIKATKMMWRALSRCTRLKTALAWRSWMIFIRAEVESERVQESKMNKLVGIGFKMMKACKWKYFRKWLESVSMANSAVLLASERAELVASHAQSTSAMRKQYRKSQMKRILKSLSSSLLRMGWNTWKYMKVEQERLQRAKRVFSRVSNTKLLSGFNQWREALQYEKKCKKLMIRVLARCTKVRTSHAWRSWLLLVRDSVRKEKFYTERKMMFLNKRHSQDIVSKEEYIRYINLRALYVVKLSQQSRALLHSFFKWRLVTSSFAFKRSAMVTTSGTLVKSNQKFKEEPIYKRDPLAEEAEDAEKASTHMSEEEQLELEAKKQASIQAAQRRKEQLRQRARGIVFWQPFVCDYYEKDSKVMKGEVCVCGSPKASHSTLAQKASTLVSSAALDGFPDSQVAPPPHREPLVLAEHVRDENPTLPTSRVAQLNREVSQEGPTKRVGTKVHTADMSVVDVDDMTESLKFPSGTLCEIHGLSKAAHINGKKVIISHFDIKTGRYQAAFSDGSGQGQFKSENLAKIAVPSPSDPPPPVPAPPDSSPRPSIQPNTLCEVTGLIKASHVNGKRIVVTHFDEATGRYQGNFSDGSGQGQFNSENLMVVQAVLEPHTPIKDSLDEGQPSKQQEPAVGDTIESSKPDKLSPTSISSLSSTTDTSSVVSRVEKETDNSPLPPPPIRRVSSPPSPILEGEEDNQEEEEPISKEGVHIKPNTVCEVTGLTKASHVNGKLITVTHFDEASGRYQGKFSDGSGQGQFLRKNLNIVSAGRLAKMFAEAMPSNVDDDDDEDEEGDEDDSDEDEGFGRHSHNVPASLLLKNSAKHSMKEGDIPLHYQQHHMIHMGMGWDMSDDAYPVDLDCAALIFDEGGILHDACFYNNLNCDGGNIFNKQVLKHSGDNRDGRGDGLDESIEIDLSALSPKISVIAFVINAHSGGSFSSVKNARVKLFATSSSDSAADVLADHMIPALTAKRDEVDEDNESFQVLVERTIMPPPPPPPPHDIRSTTTSVNKVAIAALSASGDESSEEEGFGHDTKSTTNIKNQGTKPRSNVLDDLDHSALIVGLVYRLDQNSKEEETEWVYRPFETYHRGKTFTETLPFIQPLVEEILPSHARASRTLVKGKTFIMNKSETYKIPKSVYENNYKENLLIGLGWDTFIKNSYKSKRVIATSIDLDASIVMLDRNGGLGPLIFYNNLNSEGVRHCGDNQDGYGEGDDEKILIDLNKIPYGVHELVVLVHIKSRGHSFENVSNAYIRLVSNHDDNTLLKYDFDNNDEEKEENEEEADNGDQEGIQAGREEKALHVDDDSEEEIARGKEANKQAYDKIKNGLVFARIFRTYDHGWAFQGIGEKCHGNKVNHISMLKNVGVNMKLLEESVNKNGGISFDGGYSGMQFIVQIKNLPPKVDSNYWMNTVIKDRKPFYIIKVLKSKKAAGGQESSPRTSPRTSRTSPSSLTSSKHGKDEYVEVARSEVGVSNNIDMNSNITIFPELNVYPLECLNDLSLPVVIEVYDFESLDGGRHHEFLRQVIIQDGLKSIIANDDEEEDGNDLIDEFKVPKNINMFKNFSLVNKEGIVDKKVKKAGELMIQASILKADPNHIIGGDTVIDFKEWTSDDYDQFYDEVHSPPPPPSVSPIGGGMLTPNKKKVSLTEINRSYKAEAEAHGVPPSPLSASPLPSSKYRFSTNSPVPPSRKTLSLQPPPQTKSNKRK